MEEKSYISKKCIVKESTDTRKMYLSSVVNVLCYCPALPQGHLCLSNYLRSSQWYHQPIPMSCWLFRKWLWTKPSRPRYFRCVWIVCRKRKYLNISVRLVFVQQSITTRPTTDTSRPASSSAVRCFISFTSSLIVCEPDLHPYSTGTKNYRII